MLYALDTLDVIKPISNPAINQKMEDVTTKAGRWELDDSKDTGMENDCSHNYLFDSNNCRLEVNQITEF